MRITTVARVENCVGAGRGEREAWEPDRGPYGKPRQGVDPRLPVEGLVVGSTGTRGGWRVAGHQPRVAQSQGQLETTDDTRRGHLGQPVKQMVVCRSQSRSMDIVYDIYCRG